MWRAIARSATYDSNCLTEALRTVAAPSGSTLVLVLVGALLFLGVVPAPIVLWFSLGLLCAAVCLRITRPGQFHDASQASGSFALSLLTGAPRSETASLLLLPQDHSGLLHLAMLDRDWLSAGGNLLFGSGGKGNRLTDKDLSLLTTHVHEANCRHCNIDIASSSSSSAYSNSLTPGLTAIRPPAGPTAASAAATAAAGASAPAAAAAAAAAGGATSFTSTAGGGLAARQFSFSAAIPGAGQTPQHQQLWYAGVQHGHGIFNTNDLAVSAPASAAGLWNNAMLPATAAGSSIAAATAAEQYGYSLCESDWFDSMAGRQLASGAAGSAGVTTAVSAEQQHTNSSSSSSSSVGGSGGSSSGGRGSSQPLPVVPRSFQPAAAAWQPAHASSQQLINSSSDTRVLSNFSNSSSSSSSSSSNNSSSSSSNGMLGWQGPVQQPAIRSYAVVGAAGSSGGLLAPCSTSAPTAAPAGTAARTASHNYWPATAASSPALAALAAHQSALEQSAFHQSLLKAWGSYASLDGLEDSSGMCSICLAAFKPGVLITTLPCGHGYCKDCVMPWLLQQGRQSTCPMCKAEVFT